MRLLPQLYLKPNPDDGEVRGFDFYRDPLNAKKPMQTPEEITAQDKAMKQQSWRRSGVYWKNGIA